jgi:hypothetical protein
MASGLGLMIPLLVISPVIKSAGVTSKAGFLTSEPGLQTHIF